MTYVQVLTRFLSRSKKQKVLPKILDVQLNARIETLSVVDVLAREENY